MFVVLCYDSFSPGTLFTKIPERHRKLLTSASIIIVCLACARISFHPIPPSKSTANRSGVNLFENMGVSV